MGTPSFLLAQLLSRSVVGLGAIFLPAARYHNDT